jgi:hypothetical protein
LRIERDVPARGDRAHLGASALALVRRFGAVRADGGDPTVRRAVVVETRAVPHAGRGPRRRAAGPRTIVRAHDAI